MYNNIFLKCSKYCSVVCGGVQVHPTPHFVLEGISSSMRDFIILVFNVEDFNILNFLCCLIYITEVFYCIEVFFSLQKDAKKIVSYEVYTYFQLKIRI